MVSPIGTQYERMLRLSHAPTAFLLRPDVRCALLHLMTLVLEGNTNAVLWGRASPHTGVHVARRRHPVDRRTH